jgi:hypothetical protein
MRNRRRPFHSRPRLEPAPGFFETLQSFARASIHAFSLCGLLGHLLEGRGSIRLLLGRFREGGFG